MEDFHSIDERLQQETVSYRRLIAEHSTRLRTERRLIINCVVEMCEVSAITVYSSLGHTASVAKEVCIHSFTSQKY